MKGGQHMKRAKRMVEMVLLLLALPFLFFWQETK
jgi:hypothetical protein